MTRLAFFTLLFFIPNLLLAAQEQCIPENKWLIPKSGKTFDMTSFLPQVYEEKMVLLGEHHANKHHHEWQLRLIKNLFTQNANMVIGLEMFPRESQDVLDHWVAGKIGKEAFIEQSNWDQVWSFDFELYYPLLDFARKNAIPLVAINVDKTLLKMTGKVGWENIPVDHRSGISDPAKPTEPYVRQLAISFQGHYSDPSKITKTAFLRFVQQQLLWDRAMAEALSHTRSIHPNKKVVGIVGSWHIINGHGIPHQLRHLNVKNTLTLVPWDEHLSCNKLNQQFADAVYGFPTPNDISISSN